MWRFVVDFFLNFWLQQDNKNFQIFSEMNRQKRRHHSDNRHNDRQHSHRVNHNVPAHQNLRSGVAVSIILKEDQPTGRQVQGDTMFYRRQHLLIIIRDRGRCIDEKRSPKRCQSEIARWQGRQSATINQWDLHFRVWFLFVMHPDGTAQTTERSGTIETIPSSPNLDTSQLSSITGETDPKILSLLMDIADKGDIITIILNLIL